MRCTSRNPFTMYPLTSENPSTPEYRHRKEPMSRLRSIAVATGLAIAASFAVTAPSASAATAGQLCSSAKVGTKDANLTCTKDGSRYRWAASGASAPTTKAAKTTKASSSAAKSSPAPASAPGQPTNGRFCSKAESGKRGKDNKGQSLTCKADKNGRFRWTK